jgi:hypothetical protein
MKSSITSSIRHIGGGRYIQSSVLVDDVLCPGTQAGQTGRSRLTVLRRMAVLAVVSAIPFFFNPSARAQPSSGNTDGSPSATGTTAVSFQVSTSAAALNACDLNSDGTVNIVDGQLAVNMYLGLTPCTANVVGLGICTTDVVNRVIAAALGGTCVTVVPPPHSVTLNWIASVSGNISGYNIYRSTTSGGPYGKLNSTLAAGTTFLDSTVVAGQTYYYVATAVDISNNESAFSTEAQAVIPTP